MFFNIARHPVIRALLVRVYLARFPNSTSIDVNKLRFEESRRGHRTKYTA